MSYVLLSLCFAELYTLRFRYHIIQTITSLLNCNNILLYYYIWYYISCLSPGNGQFCCKSSGNQCSHIKQSEIEICGAVIQKAERFELTKLDPVLHVPACNRVLARATQQAHLTPCVPWWTRHPDCVCGRWRRLSSLENGSKTGKNREKASCEYGRARIEHWRCCQFLLMRANAKNTRTVCIAGWLFQLC